MRSLIMWQIVSQIRASLNLLNAHIIIYIHVKQINETIKNFQQLMAKLESVPVSNLSCQYIVY
jgi:predicted SprT family Zn-dependent metalloprotease